MKSSKKDLRRLNTQVIPPKKKKTTNIRLMEMTKTIQDLRVEFNKEIEALKNTHMKMELKTPVTQLENSTSRR